MAPCDEQCRRWLVAGRVQGVGFRASVRARAVALNLVGFARNRRDGAVDVVACGEMADLERLGDYLREGPKHARVDEVAVEEAAGEGFRVFDVC